MHFRRLLAALLGLIVLSTSLALGTGTVSAQSFDAGAVVETTAVVAQAERSDNEPEPRQTLFVAGLISAVSVLVGGLIVERWRKRSEAKISETKSTDVGVDDEFNEIVSSIRDDES